MTNGKAKELAIDGKSDTRGLQKYIPILSWLPKYERGWLRLDLIAGLTIVTLLIPEGMAYAQMAGLPPETAFYAAPAALIGYALFSTSRQVVVAPTSTIAVMSAAVVGAIATSGSAEFVVYSAALAILVGLLYLLSGLLRLGFLSEFFSKPVITGFLFGLALAIAIHQVPKLFGIEPGHGTFFEQFWDLIVHLGETHGWTLFVGATSLLLLFLIEHFWERIPAALAVVVYGIAIVSVLGLEGKGVHVVGDIPAGIAPPRLPTIDYGAWRALLPGALAIVILGYAETIGAARGFASKHRYNIDPDQEMIALGVSNLGAGLMQGFAVDATLSKSEDNDKAGARTQMSAIIAAILIVITAFFFTPIFHNLPEATLAAIVISAVVGFMDIGELRRYSRIQRSDFALALVALLGVLALDVGPGFLVAVTLSILLLVYRAGKSRFSVLAREPGLDRYSDLEEHPENQPVPGLLIVRPDAFLFFANATALRQRIRRLVRESDPPARAVLLDLEGTGEMDVTAADMLVELAEDLERQEIELCLARVHKPVLEVLRRDGLIERIGEDHIYDSVQEGAGAFQDTAG